MSDYYVGRRIADGMTAHAFALEDIREAGLEDGTTEEPVQSVCGVVRSYGPWRSGPIDGELCDNCKRRIDADED